MREGKVKPREDIEAVGPEDFPSWKDSAKGLAIWFAVMIVLLLWLRTQTSIRLSHAIGMAILLALPVIAIVAAWREKR